MTRILPIDWSILLQLKIFKFIFKHYCLSLCFRPTKKGMRRVRVLYDFQARNSKELTVQKNEEVAVR